MVDNVVITVENRVPGGFLKAIDNVVIPLVEIARVSVSAGTARGLNSMIQNPDQKAFTDSGVGNPLFSASTRVHFHIDRDGYVETRIVESFEDGSFQALAAQ